MAIIGFNIKSVKGEVFDSKKEAANVNINSAPKIIEIKRADINVAGLKDVCIIDFKFETSYDPRIGVISIEGEVLLHSEKADEIIETWNEKSILHEDAVLEVMNTILRKSLVKVMQIADDLRLPPPVRLPFYQIDEKTEKKKNK